MGIYCIFAVTVGVEVVEKSAITVGIPAFVSLRVVEATSLDAMLCFQSAFSGFVGLQKLLDGSAVLDIFGSFGCVPVFVLAALHALSATKFINNYTSYRSKNSRLHLLINSDRIAHLYCHYHTTLSCPYIFSLGLTSLLVWLTNPK
jgi:hypothetical protein